MVGNRARRTTEPTGPAGRTERSGRGARVRRRVAASATATAYALPLLLMAVMVWGAVTAPGTERLHTQATAGGMSVSPAQGRPGESVTVHGDASCGQEVFWNGVPYPTSSNDGEFCTAFTAKVPNVAAGPYTLSFGYSGSPTTMFTVLAPVPPPPPPPPPESTIEVYKSAQPGQRASIGYELNEDCPASVMLDSSVVISRASAGYQETSFVIPGGTDPSVAHTLALTCGTRVLAKTTMYVDAPPPTLALSVTQGPPGTPVTANYRDHGSCSLRLTFAGRADDMPTVRPGTGTTSFRVPQSAPGDWLVAIGCAGGDTEHASVNFRVTAASGPTTPSASAGGIGQPPPPFDGASSGTGDPTTPGASQGLTSGPSAGVSGEPQNPGESPDPGDTEAGSPTAGATGPDAGQGQQPPVGAVSAGSTSGSTVGATGSARPDHGTPERGRPGTAHLKVTAAKPGGTARLTATGLPTACLTNPRATLGGRTLRTVPPGAPVPTASGVTWETGVRMPADARVGEHRIAVSCGGHQAAAATYRVNGSALESQLATSVKDPGTLDLTPANVAITTAGVVLLLLIARFPAELFNKTYEEHRDVIDAKLARVRRPFVAVGTLLPRGARVSAAFAATAVLFALVEPGSGVDGRTALLAGQIGIVLVVTWFTYQHVGEMRARRLSGVRGPLRFAGGAFVVAGVCVAVSRAAHLVPGYVYGIVVVYAVTRQGVGRWTRRRESGTILIGAWLTLAVAVGAWFAHAPVQDALGPRTAAGQVAAGVLTLIFVAGVETVVFGLLPLRFLDGHKLRERGVVAWGLPFMTATVLFVHVLVTEYVTEVPAETAARSLAGALGLLAGFALVSVAFWAFFVRYDRVRATASRSVPPPSAATSSSSG